MVRINNIETPILQGLATNVPTGGLIVEIGAAWGWSASKMAEASDDSVRLITVDPWTLAPQKQQPEREQLFWKTIEPYKDRIAAIKSFSRDVDLPAILHDKPIDLLFIDGDHHYQPVREDYLKFSPFVRLGGFLVFHDYVNDRWPGVRRAVDEFAVASDLWDWHTQERFWIGKRKGV
jgi:predicted O-methyltransferase YrrM